MDYLTTTLLAGFAFTALLYVCVGALGLWIVGTLIKKIHEMG